MYLTMQLLAALNHASPVTALAISEN